MDDIPVPDKIELPDMNRWILGNSRIWATNPEPYHITLSTGDYSGSTVYRPSVTAKDFVNGLTADIMHSEILKSLGRKEEAEVKVNMKQPCKGKHVAYIDDAQFLTQDKILTTLSAIKGRLMLETAPIHIKELQCSMTPETRKNIVAASRRLRMYGKKMPIVARFDEWGNQLPDTIDFGDSFDGVTLKIVDPTEKGDLYLELTAIEFDNPMYDPKMKPEWVYGDITF